MLSENHEAQGASRPASLGVSTPGAPRPGQGSEQGLGAREGQGRRKELQAPRNPSLCLLSSLHTWASECLFREKLRSTERKKFVITLTLFFRKYEVRTQT